MGKNKKIPLFNILLGGCVFLLAVFIISAGWNRLRDLPGKESETGKERRTSGTEKQEETDLSVVRAHIQETYGNHLELIEEVEESGTKQLQITLPVQDKEAARIKKEIETAYPGAVVFRLSNNLDGRLIVTEEDDDRYKLDILFQYNMYETCRLVSMDDIDRYRTEIDVRSIEEQVDEDICDDIEKTPRIVPYEKEFVEDGDLLKISFRVYDGDIEYLHATCETVLCGHINFDEQIESSVKGRKLGETYYLDYYRSGKKIKCEVTPLYCYRLEEYIVADDVFARENSVYQTMKEWREARIRDKMKWQRKELWDDLILRLGEASEFVFDEEILTRKAAELYVSTTMLAEEFGIETEDIIEHLYFGSTEKYIRFCYAQARQEIAEYLLVHGIAEFAALSVKPGEMLEFCRNNGLDWEQLDESGKAEYSYELLREKVRAYMIGP